MRRRLPDLPLHRRAALPPVRWLLAAHLAAVGCTKPDYNEDDAAQSPSDDEDDDEDDDDATPSGEAGSEAGKAQAGDASGSRDRDAGAALPSWAASLVGRYAMQSVTYSDDGTVSRLRERALAEIRASDGGYELVLESCEQVVTTPLYTARTRAPEKLPPRRHRLVVDADSFSSVPVDIAIGYEAEPPTACLDKPGALVDKRPFQTWITGSSCRCPGEPVPTADDCRVLDPDDDGLPGYSIEIRALTAAVIYGATADYSKLVMGRLQDDGSLVAHWDARSQSEQYGCRPAPCAADTSGPAPVCPPETSRADFKSLANRPNPPTAWTCAAVVNRAAELFTEPEPSAPARCTR